MTSASTSSETGRAPADPHVTLQPVELTRLPEREPPPLLEKGWLHGRSPQSDPVTIIAHQDALRQIAAHGHSNRRVELGGALLGQVYRHQSQVYVEVQAALPVETGDHGPIHFTFTADSWAQLQQDRTTHHPNLEFVGWFHTHPGLGVFYSGDDVVVHSAAFTLPWQVGLVVDPVQDEAAFFGWVEGQLAGLSGFYELLARQSEPVVNWHMVRASAWQDSYEDHLAADPQARPVYTQADEEWPALRPGRLGLIVGTLGLLLGFFLLVGWVVPLTQQVNRLESVVLTLADESLAENAAACPDPRLRILTPLAGSMVRAGSELEIIGSATHPEASRYRIEVRPAGTDLWTLVDDQRRDTDLGLLASWETTSLQPGMYEMRLTAVDRNNVRLVNTERCLISLNVIP